MTLLLSYKMHNLNSTFSSEEMLKYESVHNKLK